MWINIQQNFSKSFFNFTSWLSNNEKRLNLSLQDFFKLSLDSQYSVIREYFISRNLNVDDDLEVNHGTLLVFKRNSENQFYDELRSMITKVFKYINGTLVSHKMKV